MRVSGNGVLRVDKAVELGVGRRGAAWDVVGAPHVQRGVDAALGPHLILVQLKHRPRPRVEVGRLPHLPLGVRRRHHGPLARDVALEDERK